MTIMTTIATKTNSLKIHRFHFYGFKLSPYLFNIQTESKRSATSSSISRSVCVVPISLGLSVPPFSQSGSFGKTWSTFATSSVVITFPVSSTAFTRSRALSFSKNVSVSAPRSACVRSATTYGASAGGGSRRARYVAGVAADGDEE